MRQLLVSTGVAPTYTAGVLAAGAVDIVLKPVVGQATPFNPIVAGQGIADSDSICFVQGTAAGKNIQTPWIPARDIVRWTGRSYTPQVAQVSTLTFATAATVAGTMMLKLTSVGIGQEQYKRKTALINVTAGQTANNIALAFLSELTGIASASLVSGTSYPIVGVDFATASMTIPGAVLVITGTTVSTTAVPNTDLGSWATASEDLDGSNGTTVTVVATASPTPGSGDGDLLVGFEQQLQGNVGFYNRITQPNTPASYIVAATNYDLYSLSFLTGPVGQIKGVDNKREIIIAFNADTAAPILAAKLVFESKINGYLATAPGAFAAMTL